MTRKKMDLFGCEKKKRNDFANRWNRIEKKHISSIKIGHRNDATQNFCKNLLKNKQFVNEHHMNVLMGDEPKMWCLDPNLVMDIRHMNIRRRTIAYEKSTSNKMQPNADDINGKTKDSLNDRERFRQMQALNSEIDKFKERLENNRPKSNLFYECKEKKCKEKFTLTNEWKELPLVATKTESEYEFFKSPLDNSMIRRDYMEYFENASTIEWSSPEFSTNTTFFDSSVDLNEEYSEQINELEENPIPAAQSPHETKTNFEVPVHPEEKPKTCKSNDCLELVIKPTFTVNLHENQSDMHIETNNNNNMYKDSTTHSMIDHKISLDQHMSIVIKKIDINGCRNISSQSTIDANDGYALCSQNSTERTAIINELFRKQMRDNHLILQKYFLRWVHYTTIEKLTRRNPEQTRLKKMETFLQNITFERKRTLKKLRSMSKTNENTENDASKKLSVHQMDSPRLLARKYNNKIKIQQDIIELQKLKLQRQERVIAELKLAKILEDATDSQTNLKDELKFVAKNGCANSRSKARCLQIAGNLKDDEDDETYAKIQANGLTAPKFLIEMQARALEREMKHRQAQERRIMLEREKEELRNVAEEAKRQQDKQAKRERFKELRRKRLEEKQQKVQKEMERLKCVADLERAKSFYRYRTLKFALSKFRNLVKWKKHNLKLANEFRRRLICRNVFTKWKNLVDRVWSERKAKADASYNRHCLRVGWSLWYKYYMVEHSKCLLAVDWYEMRISERALRIWHNVTTQRRMIFEIKLKQAEAHFDWQMKWKILDHWRRLKLLLQIERETEERRERWRNKIHEFLPDYVPRHDDSN